MDLVDKINDKLRQFLDKSSDISLQESHKELFKCHQFVKETNKNLNTINIDKNSSSRGVDYAAYYMCKCQLALYNHAALLTYTFNLHEELEKEQKSKKKKKHVNKFSRT